MLDLVLTLWISWVLKYKSLFFTTNNSTENILYLCLKMNIIKPHRKDVTVKLNIKLLNLWSTLLNFGLSKCPHALCSFSCTEMHNVVK